MVHGDDPIAEETFDLKHCRSCLSDAALPISDSLAESLQQATGVAMSDERIPRRLCRRCIATVRKFVAFRQASRMADEMLRDLVEKNIVSKLSIKIAREECSVYLPKLEIKHNLTNVFDAEYTHFEPICDFEVGSECPEIQYLDTQFKNDDIFIDPKKIIKKNVVINQTLDAVKSESSIKPAVKVVKLKRVSLSPNILSKLKNIHKINVLPFNKEIQLKSSLSQGKQLKQVGVDNYEINEDDTDDYEMIQDDEDDTQNKDGDAIQDGDAKQEVKTPAKQDGDAKQGDTTFEKPRKVKKTKSVHTRPWLERQKDMYTFKAFFTAELLPLEKQKELFAKKIPMSDRAYKCEICFRAFKRVIDFENHLACHSDEKDQLICQVCFIRFRSKEQLERHCHVQHNYMFSCKKCSYETQARSEAYEHIYWHRGIRHECEECGQQFEYRSALRAHERTKHPTYSVCGLCGYSFLARGMDRHINIKHRKLLNQKDTTIPEDGPECTECDVKFANEEALKTHLKVSSRHNKLVQAGKDRANRKNHSPITCEQCGEVCGTVRQYESHFEQHHGAAVRKQHKELRGELCDTCGKICRSKFLLKVHINAVHTNAVIYTCEYCSKTFTHRLKYTRHLGEHYGNHSNRRRVPTTCPICHKLFPRRANMMRHKSTVHTDERNFKCDYCGKAFKTKLTHAFHVQHVHLEVPRPKRNKRPTKRKATEGLRETIKRLREMPVLIDEPLVEEHDMENEPDLENELNLENDPDLENEPDSENEPDLEEEPDLEDGSNLDEDSVLIGYEATDDFEAHSDAYKLEGGNMPELS